MRTLVTFALILLASISCSSARAQESLLIGPGDQLHILVLDMPELEQHPRVTDAGTIPLINLGSLAVAGLTPAQASDKIHDYFVERKFMNHPAITVTVEQFATQSVSVLGEVKMPGSYPITTRRSVLDAIALAEGLLPTADRNITIQRRDRSIKPISYDLSNDGKVAMETQVQVYPGDIVLVPRAHLSYVLGAVTRPGGYVMQDNHSELSVIEAVAAAGGTLPSAVPSHAKLIHRSLNGAYQEVDINFSRIQKGKEPDLRMQPDDVVYIPFSYLRNVAATGSGIVASAAQASIYAIP